MDPQTYENKPSFDMPPPKSGEATSQPAEQFRNAVNEAHSAIAVEQGQSGPAPVQPAQPAAPPASPPAADPMAQPPVTAPQGSTSAAWMPQIADDVDLIEKEWVDKAKEIVAQTAHDPYLQNKEMNKVKAEYLKKRYNKDLKLSD